MLENGMFLVDRYEIIEKIGAGGMSDVYKAKDHILGRVVAIKVLKAEFSEDINFVTKFRTEAQSAAGLEHPNIVNIYDVGSENGMHFIVMEYVEGITLKTYVEKKGQLSFKEATSIAIQVARGIEAAHNKDITHRDIKPQNIMISTEGKVKVTDFGIAKAISSNTISSDAMGSVHYASPEQARNGFIDGRSDIYSLGVVMYEMVTGRVPFDGETTVAVAIQHLQEEMVVPTAFAPELPISYEKIILKTTQKSPERRYQTIGELLADLRQALVTPDEDFVVIAPVVIGDTRVINGEELEMIQNSAEEADLDKENGFASAEDGEDEYDEDDENEDASAFLDPKMEKIVNYGGIAVLAVIIIIIIFLVFNIFSNIFNFGGGDSTESESETQTETESESVEMINIVGMSLEEATEELKELGLEIEVVSYEKSNTEEDGTILKQNEKEGNMVEKGTAIKVTVAGTDGELIDVPNVVNALEADAVSTLQGKGFNVTRDFAASDSVEKGRVISQEPASGGKLEAGSYVTIVISEGKGSELVPGNLVGKDIDTVTSKLESLGFVVAEVETTSDSYPEPGTVINVEGAGTSREVGSTIKVTVSTGPKTVKQSTYKFSNTYTKEGAVSYTYQLLDASGNVLLSDSGTGSSVTITKTGMSASSGKVVITWTIQGEFTVDSDGDGVMDSEPTTSTQKFEESVNFTAE